MIFETFGQKRVFFTVGSNTSKSGMIDVLFELRSKYLLIDDNGFTPFLGPFGVGSNPASFKWTIILSPSGTKITSATDGNENDPFAFSHVSLCPVPFSINLAESLNSYATDEAIIIIAVRLKKTPKKVKNVERILLLIFYPPINTNKSSNPIC